MFAKFVVWFKLNLKSQVSCSHYPCISPLRAKITFKVQDVHVYEY